MLFSLHSLPLFCCCVAWEYNMLLCDGRGCSRSVPITFRNRKNKMYHEQDYFCETPLQLCNSECFKDTSDLWHVYVHQTSFEALPIAGVQFCTLFPTFLFQRCFVPDSHQGAWLKLRRRMVLRHPHLEGQSQHLALFRDRRLTVEPVARGGHCQRVVCVSGGLNCL